MENTLNIDGQIFYLCSVKGLLKEPKDSGTGAKHAGLFAYLKPELGEIPDFLIGATQDKDGKYLPVVVREEVFEIIHNAFMNESLVLINLTKIGICESTRGVVTGALDVNSSMIFIKDL